MDGIYKTVEEYNPNEKRKIWTFFNDMIADMLSNIKFNPMVTELTLKLSISLVFITHYILLSDFTIPKNIRPNSTHYFIIKIPKKQELQQIMFNHSSDIDLKNFMCLYKICTTKAYSFLVVDATLASDYLLVRNNLSGRI